MTEKVLVCMPADATWTVLDSSFDRHCSRCGVRVMIAPSGREMIANTPELVEVICFDCWQRAGGAEAAADDATVCREAGNAILNPLRRRNP